MTCTHSSKNDQPDALLQPLLQSLLASTEKRILLWRVLGQKWKTNAESGNKFRDAHAEFCCSGDDDAHRVVSNRLPIPLDRGVVVPPPPKGNRISGVTLTTTAAAPAGFTTNTTTICQEPWSNSLLCRSERGGGHQSTPRVLGRSMELDSVVAFARNNCIGFIEREIATSTAFTATQRSRWCHHGSPVVEGHSDYRSSKNATDFDRVAEFRSQPRNSASTAAPETGEDAVPKSGNLAVIADVDDDIAAFTMLRRRYPWLRSALLVAARQEGAGVSHFLEAFCRSVPPLTTLNGPSCRASGHSTLPPTVLPYGIQIHWPFVAIVDVRAELARFAQRDCISSTVRRRDRSLEAAIEAAVQKIYTRVSSVTATNMAPPPYRCTHCSPCHSPDAADDKRTGVADAASSGPEVVAEPLTFTAAQSEPPRPPEATGLDAPRDGNSMQTPRSCDEITEKEVEQLSGEYPPAASASAVQISISAHLTTNMGNKRVDGGVGSKDAIAVAVATAGSESVQPQSQPTKQPLRLAHVNNEVLKCISQLHSEVFAPLIELNPSLDGVLHAAGFCGVMLRKLFSIWLKQATHLAWQAPLGAPSYWSPPPRQGCSVQLTCCRLGNSGSRTGEAATSEFPNCEKGNYNDTENAVSKGGNTGFEKSAAPPGDYWSDPDNDCCRGGNSHIRFGKAEAITSHSYCGCIHGTRRNDESGARITQYLLMGGGLVQVVLKHLSALGESSNIVSSEDQQSSSYQDRKDSGIRQGIGESSDNLETESRASIVARLTTSLLEEGMLRFRRQNARVLVFGEAGLIDDELPGFADTAGLSDVRQHSQCLRSVPTSLLSRPGFFERVLVLQQPLSRSAIFHVIRSTLVECNAELTLNNHEVIGKADEVIGKADEVIGKANEVIGKADEEIGRADEEIGKADAEGEISGSSIFHAPLSQWSEIIDRFSSLQPGAIRSIIFATCQGALTRFVPLESAQTKVHTNREGELKPGCSSPLLVSYNDLCHVLQRCCRGLAVGVTPALPSLELQPYALDDPLPNRSHFASIAGNDQLICDLCNRVVRPFRANSLDAPTAIILSGATGSGKSLIASSIAKACGATLFAVSSSDILSSMLGETERSLRRVFASARSRAPAVVVFENADVTFPKPQAQMELTAGTGRRVLIELLRNLDGLRLGRRQLFGRGAPTTYSPPLDTRILVIFTVTVTSSSEGDDHTTLLNPRIETEYRGALRFKTQGRLPISAVKQLVQQCLPKPSWEICHHGVLLWNQLVLLLPSDQQLSSFKQTKEDDLAAGVRRPREAASESSEPCPIEYDAVCFAVAQAASTAANCGAAVVERLRAVRWCAVRRRIGTPQPNAQNTGPRAAPEYRNGCAASRGICLCDAIVVFPELRGGKPATSAP